LEPLSSSSVSLDVKYGADSLNQKGLGSRPQVALPHSTMIGELGVQAELVGEGVLICSTSGSSPEGLGGTVAVRKLAKGKVEMEGNVSEVYYIVRREIYNLHALVTA
jgi:cleavage and polyadenylation specificity factor subunit 2